MIGTSLSHYRITEKLGQGGMGEVYRAEDTNLSRQVAIKVLPDEFAHDAERLARFEREAKLLASLNHPNIAAIHGLEEHEGKRFLVLELVEGQTLAERLKKGRIPVDETLDICRQIAEGLEAAHEKGIIHRDLKPANVKVTPEGKVKILDFGLAKAFIEEPLATDPSKSPTVTSPATQIGAILGTAAYMSPEQTRGKIVDKRTDIWAFGCVLYECLTGRKAFGGETVTDIIGAIVKSEPDWRAIPPGTPAYLQHVLSRCLSKDLSQRFRDIGDVRIDLGDHLEDSAAQDYDRRPAILRRPTVLWAAVAAIALALALGVWIGRQWHKNALNEAALELPGIRTEILLPENSALAFQAGSSVSRTLLAISADGSKLAFVGRSGSGRQLYIREINSYEIKPVRGTEGAMHPFFSPDGNSIGFLTPDKVKTVSLDGSNPVPLCNAQSPWKATWARDGFIYYGENQGTVLRKIRAKEGASELVATLKGREICTFSCMLPNGEYALLSCGTAGIGFDYRTIVALNVHTQERKKLNVSGYDARYVSPGYLVYARFGALMSVPFDLQNVAVLGEPKSVLPEVGMESLFGQVQATLADNGTLVYCPGGDTAVGYIARVDRNNVVERLPNIPEQVYGAFDLSSDESTLAIHVADVKDYISIFDLNRQEPPKRLTYDQPLGWPKWDPKGERIAFTISRSTGSEIGIYDRATGEIEANLLKDECLLRASSWHPSGKILAIDRQGAEKGDIGFLNLKPPASMSWLLPSDFTISMSDFSPDGKWYAFNSYKTGECEVCIREFPIVKQEPRQVSAGSAGEPIWVSNGELVYMGQNQDWMATKIKTEPTLDWLSPRRVWATDFVDTPGLSYDVSRDGRHIYVVKSSRKPDPRKLNVIQNWFEELKRLCPTGK